MNKIIVVDSSLLAHQSIFQFGQMKRLKNAGKLKGDWIPNSDYTYFSKILGYLKKVVVGPYDKVIFVGDGFNSWRKFFYPTYKGQRKDLRAAWPEIDWKVEYDRIDKMNRLLNEVTDWYFIKISDLFTGDKLRVMEWENTKYSEESFIDKSYSVEADDIAATIAQAYSKDYEVIVLTTDGDWKQLAYWGVKYFNLKKKVKGLKGGYENLDREDALKLLNDKIRKGDKSDNILVDKKNDTPEDCKIRELIIDLIHLPDWVTCHILTVLEECLKEEKRLDYSRLPFPNSLGKVERFGTIYSTENLVTEEDSIKAVERKEKKKAKKKLKEASK